MPSLEYTLTIAYAISVYVIRDHPAYSEARGRRSAAARLYCIGKDITNVVPVDSVGAKVK